MEGWVGGSLGPEGDFTVLLDLSRPVATRRVVTMGRHPAREVCKESWRWLACPQDAVPVRHR